MDGGCTAPGVMVGAGLHAGHAAGALRRRLAVRVLMFSE